VRSAIRDDRFRLSEAVVVRLRIAGVSRTARQHAVALSVLVDLLQPGHPGNKVGARSLEGEVVVVAHQHLRPRHTTAALSGFAKGPEEQLLILAFGGDENGFTAIAPRHDVVDGAGKLDAVHGGPWARVARGWVEVDI
jgi:hypothetical protein